jgi:RimJ/RimL family protein N-acetyltransferase
MTVPTIETSRLLLRGHELSDFDACAAMWADPGVVRYIGNRLSTRGESWARMLRYRGHWALLGYGFWAIVDRASGAYLGEGGLADFRRDFDPPLGLEAGWAFATHAHGKGYATEAMRAAFAWGAANLAEREVECVIEPGNTASFGVARKCGFVDTGRTIALPDGAQLVVLRAPLHSAAHT